MDTTHSAYGLWGIVLLNSILFIAFASSFVRRGSKTDWRSMGGFSAFVVALFAEMYGFPLTIYVLSGWLQKRFPGVDIFSHNAGHLWHTLFGLKGDAHTDPIHITSMVLIGLGFFLLYAAWKRLHAAQKEGKLATEGVYAVIRHPQYVAFIAILTGFLLQWPTLLTLLMYPVLVVMYLRLAKKEEREVRNSWGEAYEAYSGRVPAFVPKRYARTSATTTTGHPKNQGENHVDHGTA